MLTVEKINSNYVLWTEKLKQYDCFSEEMINDIGDALKDASFGMTESCGSAYQGSMIDTVLNTLCRIAFQLNENTFGYNGGNKALHPTLYVNNKMLMRVLLLQHISKALMFKPCRSQWKVNNGTYYEFSNVLPTTMKCGERSRFMCMKYNIELTEEEYEAMGIIDKADEGNLSYMTPLSEIVKIANQLTAIELYRKNLNNKKEEEIEK